MATIYMAVILTLSYSLMTITSSSGSSVPECSQSRYLPYLDAHYKNDHIVFAMDGQNVTISCTISCPSNSESVNHCSDNIRQDWMIIDPSEDKIYYINAATSRNKFIRRFEIDEATIEFSNSNRLDFEQCSMNETNQFQFSLTLQNFTSSLEGLMIICGLRRYGNISADYHLVKEYARLRQISTGPVPTTTAAPHDPTTTTTFSTTAPHDSTTTTTFSTTPHDPTTTTTFSPTAPHDSTTTTTFSATAPHDPTTTAATTVTTASLTTSTTISTNNTSPSSSPVSVVGYQSSWPDKASFPVTALLLAVCIFLMLLTAVLITCNIKLQRKLKDSEKRYNSYAELEKQTSHMNVYCHYDAFPKHPWQTAVFLDSSNNINADLWYNT